MPDLANLDKISQLWWEVRNIDHVLSNFDAGGTIVSMTVSGHPTATISTTGIPYPPGMTAGIRAALDQRKQAIMTELAALGIT